MTQSWVAQRWPTPFPYPTASQPLGLGCVGHPTPHHVTTRLSCVELGSAASCLGVHASLGVMACLTGWSLNVYSAAGGGLSAPLTARLPPTGSLLANHRRAVTHRDRG